MANQQLSAVQQQRLTEYFKCKKDPVYFMENYIKLSAAGGDTTVKLYDRQKDFVKDLTNKHHVISCKSRQTGVSTITQMWITHTVCFYKNVTIGIVSKSGKESTDFCRYVMSMIGTLPEWIKPKFEKQTEQTFILDNGCKFYADQVNESNPEGLLRGKSMCILVVDEAAFIPKIDDAYTSIAPTLFKAQKTAKENGIPYGTIVISTPNKTVGKGKWYYQLWTKAVNNDSIFHPFKLHWKMIKEFADDVNWYKTQCDLLQNIHWKIAQELDMQFVASQNSFFPPETIEALNTCHTEPISKINLLGHDLYQFEQSAKDKFYLIGIDTASASGNDNSTIVVFDYETFNQVAEFRSKLRVDEFCRIITLVTRIYPNNLIVPEANSYGNQVCEYLTQSTQFYNIYQSKVKTNSNSTGTKSKFKYGLTTGPQNRPLMIDSLYTYVTEDPSRIKSERLALELLGLVDNGHGKVIADDGEKDDLALATSFCSFVRTYDPPLNVSKNMQDQTILEDMADVSSWNDDRGRRMSSPEICEIRGIESDDRLGMLEHTNKLIHKHVKSNMLKIMDDNSSGSVIDILQMLDPRNEKNKKPF
jgi:hypothetical protein